MKTILSSRFPFALTLKRSGMLAKVIVAGAAAFTLLNCPAVHGATLQSKAPNAAVYFGLPFASLSFDNPLTGSEMVLSHKVLDWRDADYLAGPPRSYGDWSVNDTNNIDGSAEEIYLRTNGHSAWTTTTVPSTIVSIHLNSDQNDGLAAVLVDGVQVATFDMNTAPCCQTILIIVTGLGNTTHTITVNDLGKDPLGWKDVHIVGAAALQESENKWNQPPTGAPATNLYYGWNQQSIEGMLPWAADDWVCTNAVPVTKIRWWGSFANWAETNVPIVLPGFRIKFWTDVPKGADPNFPGFSHPGVLATNAIQCTSFSANFAGWDYDPRYTNYEACFVFEQTLDPTNWFYQQPGPTGTNIYWINITAMQGGTESYLWGWKTRPRDTNSLAPDDAVMFDPMASWYQPLYWPTTNDSWDLAFELISGSTSAGGSKWEQLPDLSYYGIDVNATSNGPPPNPFLLADDFLCTSPTYITNITIWGSWSNNLVPGNSPTNVVFTLSIHTDATNITYPYNSMPGNWLWTNTFWPTQFTCVQVTTNLYEWWWNPSDPSAIPNGDSICYRYDFQIPSTKAFYQQGTPSNPKIYWLDVQARPGQNGGATGGYKFGWKTSTNHWHDDACWVMASEIYNGPWNKLTYPPNHPYYGGTIDLAFRLNGTTNTSGEVTKWSQPPVVYTNAFNGWNQPSGGGYPVVADDWACTNAKPVTDIHWWGSFIGWSESSVPTGMMPDAFVIQIWPDVPKGVDASFSHPGYPYSWYIYCTNFTCSFVGWDSDPRNPGAAPDACFKFEQDLYQNEWFQQSQFGTQPTNIFWISIAAVYNTTPNPTYPFGWKTRPHDTNSLAPDDAVVSVTGGTPPWYPIYYPTTNDSWDMAFELTTRECIQVVCSTNIVVTCASTNGAVVNFQSYATNFCTGASLPVTCWPTNGSLFPVGTSQVCCTNITGGVTYYCCFTVTVFADTNPPNLNCPSIVTNTDPGQCSKSNVTFLVTAVDDCDPNPVIVCNPTNGSTFPKGVTTVNCTATDSSGNTNVCSFTVTILDNEKPSVTCSTNIVANTDPGQCSKSNVTWTATATDNCPGVVTNCNPPSGSTFAKGTNTVLCTATDSSGNTNVCSFTVTIRDLEPPVVHCPSNIVATVDLGQNFKTNVTWSTTATDNCAVASLVCNPTNGSTFPFGTNTVCCTATDTSGNTNQCCFPVTICWPKPTTNIVITNIVFTSKFNGWNEPSVYSSTSNIAADDWVCTTTNPVTDIHWWGSFLNWQSNTPPTLTNVFHITIWSDVPKVGTNFSHPNQVLWETDCTNTTWQFMGWDVDPQTLAYESCFRFDQRLATGAWFYQTNGLTGTNIYWLSIAAYPQGPYVWGWKTLPRQTNSPAPDDAVRISSPRTPHANDYYVSGGPIYWPTSSNSWDLAFELVSSYTNPVTKWEQPPDLTTAGMDVDDTSYNPPTPQSYLLADDFRCNSSGPLTDITIWGSWTNNWEADPATLSFTLSIHKNITNGYSMPGQLLWQQTFAPGQYQWQWLPNSGPEGWLTPPGTPPGNYIFPGDSACFQYDFHVATNAFVQTNGNIYWLDVQAQLALAGGPIPGPQPAFGWKTTSPQYHFSDDAVWVNATEPYTNAWPALQYPPGHPYFPQSIDLAFRLAASQSYYQLKWSQPPVTSRYFTVEWTWENNIHYQLQGTFALSNAPAHCVWTNVGPEVIGPVHQQSDSNTTAPQRFYRVVAPFVDP